MRLFAGRNSTRALARIVAKVDDAESLSSVSTSAGRSGIAVAQEKGKFAEGELDNEIE